MNHVRKLQHRVHRVFVHSLHAVQYIAPPTCATQTNNDNMAGMRRIQHAPSTAIHGDMCLCHQRTTKYFWFHYSIQNKMSGLQK